MDHKRLHRTPKPLFVYRHNPPSPTCNQAFLCTNISHAPLSILTYNIMSKQFPVLIILFLFCIDTMAQDICDSILERGIRNVEEVYESHEKFNIIQNQLCTLDIDSASSFQNAASSAGFSFPIIESVLEFSSSTLKEGASFSERFSSFCESNYEQYVGSTEIHNLSTNIDRSIVDSWSGCINRLADLRRGVYAFSDVYFDRSGFTLTVTSVDDTDLPLELRSVSPASLLNCTNAADGEDLPISSNTSIVVDCFKTDPSHQVTAVISTNRGIANRITIPPQQQISLVSLQRDIEALQEDMRQVAAVPRGSVAAFDLDRCPQGWSPYSRGEGRFIVGVGNDDGNNRDQNGTVLTAKSLSQVGGEEQHTLTINEMPSHNHGYLRTDFRGPGVGHDGGNSMSFHNKQDTERTGGGSPHNNMPPYVALRLCKKD